MERGGNSDISDGPIDQVATYIDSRRELRASASKYFPLLVSRNVAKRPISPCYGVAKDVSGLVRVLEATEATYVRRTKRLPWSE